MDDQGVHVEPIGQLHEFISEEAWDNMPKVQYRATMSKRLKCESQQQYSVIDNVPVLTTTGTNARRPGIKRKWSAEREGLLEGIKRMRVGILQPNDF